MLDEQNEVPAVLVQVEDGHHRAAAAADLTEVPACFQYVHAPIPVAGIIDHGKSVFEKFADDYRLVGTHLGRAQAKHAEGLPKLETIQRTLPGELKSTPSGQLPMEESTDRSAREPLE